MASMHRGIHCWHIDAGFRLASFFSNVFTHNFLIFNIVFSHVGNVMLHLLLQVILLP